MKHSIIEVISFQANFESEVIFMSKREEYVQAEKERICEILQGIDQLEALSCIYTFTSSFAQHKKGGAK